ncbi:cyclophilin-like peptidyl-prolyl cis-trans isomerase family protein [Actinidia rufa]|uniref:Cyclophilin-like peptidyl-prolyl cis-trans isomerase family protein n=1 Tax=Actinidia rufa TaxID=165716 RepID=A0A7J0GYF1_9ERIC|nr:cyclophilin-like peptidyl-prolyl cis-trans isomerase family protein [Actinidia rufa]
MSSVYVSEPPTKGKVIVNTTYGPLDIELWPKEAPKAVRNFVQLCLEGYYDNTIFHRMIKSFLLQGGDPTGTGTGGESIYGSVFADEFHSRLRFNHRGIVACANAGPPHSNGSQFFITLDRCDWLDRKHTIFGKVTGDSIYNLIRLGEVETDKNDRPLDPPPKITSVEVLWNPFEDIVPRVATARSLPSFTVDADNKAPKKKAVKKLNLLSFGEEAEEEEKELAAVKTKIKSSHDVLNDPRLLKEENPSKEPNISEVKAARDLQLNVREALSSKREELEKESEVEESVYSDDDEASFDARMRLQILRKRKELGDLPTKQKFRNESFSPKDHEKSPPRSNAENYDDQPKVEKLYLKKKGIGSEARSERMVKTNADLQLLGEAERERQLQKQKKRRRQGHEDDILAKLEKFKVAISTKPVESNSKGEDLSDWTGVKLKFAPEPGKDNMSRSDDPNDYVLHDPLLEKGKEKFNRMQAKQKRREREWAGKSLT